MAIQPTAYGRIYDFCTLHETTIHDDNFPENLLKFYNRFSQADEESITKEESLVPFKLTCQSQVDAGILAIRFVRRWCHNALPNSLELYAHQFLPYYQPFAKSSRTTLVQRFSIYLVLSFLVLVSL
jgi:hypothetical protein